METEWPTNQATHTENWRRRRRRRLRRRNSSRSNELMWNTDKLYAITISAFAQNISRFVARAHDRPNVDVDANGKILQNHRRRMRSFLNAIIYEILALAKGQIVIVISSIFIILLSPPRSLSLSLPLTPNEPTAQWTVEKNCSFRCATIVCARRLLFALPPKRTEPFGSVSWTNTRAHIDIRSQKNGPSEEILFHIFYYVNNSFLRFHFFPTQRSKRTTHRWWTPNWTA